MGRLIFIGLGLTKGDLTLRGLELAKECDILVTEEYTSMVLDGGLDWLEKELGLKIRPLARENVEQGDEVLALAMDNTVGFLVAGDAMMATTHTDIHTRAKEKGIETIICHGISIFTAAASVLGLMHYKFGRVATLPYPEGDYLPTSPYDVILENKEMGLHTLVLLDIKAHDKRYMSVAEAIDVLEQMEAKTGKGMVDDELLLCACARVGTKNEKTVAGKLASLRNIDMGPPLHCLVVPGNLHFTEEESLEQMWF